MNRIRRLQCEPLEPRHMLSGTGIADCPPPVVVSPCLDPACLEHTQVEAPPVKVYPVGDLVQPGPPSHPTTDTESDNAIADPGDDDLKLKVYPVAGLELAPPGVSPTDPNLGSFSGGLGGGFGGGRPLAGGIVRDANDALANLNETLRKYQSLNVTVEVRFIVVNEDFIDRIGVDFDFDVDDGGSFHRVAVPDGGTLLIGGLLDPPADPNDPPTGDDANEQDELPKLADLPVINLLFVPGDDVEDDSPNPLPTLSELPYINRLFNNVGATSIQDGVVLSITPRIIIQEEAE